MSGTVRQHAQFISMIIYISMLRIFLLLSAGALVRHSTMNKHMVFSDLITCFTKTLHSCMVPSILPTHIQHMSLELTRNSCDCQPAQSSCITVAKFLVQAVCSDCPASAACTTAMTQTLLFFSILYYKLLLVSCQQSSFLPQLRILQIFYVEKPALQNLTVISITLSTSKAALGRMAKKAKELRNLPTYVCIL